MRTTILLLIVILITGCTSVYHLGANVHDDGGALYRPVPKKVASDLKAFEEECISAIINGDADKLSAIANPLLHDSIKAETTLLPQLTLIKSKFMLSDNFKSVKLSNLYFWLDDMISQDPYKIYDFIASQYEIVGKPNVQVLLLIDKKPGFKLWGFSIHPYDPDNKKSELTYFSKEIKGWWTFGVRPYQWWAFAYCCK